MVKIERILCPIDFSETSRHALEHAVVLAGWYEARLTALHVETVAAAMPPLFAAVADAPPRNVRRAQTEDLLRDWLSDAVRRGVQTELEIVEGTPDHQILKRAASLPADLLVMGTHGRTGFDRVLLGSTAEKVLRKAPCPVMTVPPPAAATSTLPFKRIICPVDFSEPSMAALRFAESIAKESDARLALVHVIEWPEQQEFLIDGVFDPAEYRMQLETAARRQLESAVSAETRTWCTPVLTLAYGKPYRVVLELAAKEQTDLIVMGVHGRNALDVWLFGSTTHQVVRRASCPVLTLRG